MTNQKFSDIYDISSDLADTADGGAAFIIRLKPKTSAASQTATRQTAAKQTATSAQDVAQGINIPQTKLIKTTAQQIEAEQTSASSTPQQNAFSTTQAQTNTCPTIVGQAVTNASLPFPQKPTEPNKIVGMVLTAQNELVAEAILEIKNSKNQVIRTIKTNSLGQFFVSTPLLNDSYIIETKKEGLQFEPKQFNLTGQIVEPLEIKSYN